jgi:hypothetical protein
MRCGKTLIPVLGGLLKFLVDLGGGGGGGAELPPLYFLHVA